VHCDQNDSVLVADDIAVYLHMTSSRDVIVVVVAVTV